MTPTVTVAIATYNGRELLERCLASLAKQSFADFRTVVVDDASTDDTVEWLQSERPDIELVRHEHNRGVTAALNSSLRASSSEFTLLLNNDVELEPDCLAELVAALRGHPEAGAAVPKLLDGRDHALLDGAGDTFHWSGTGWRRGHGERDEGQYDEPRAIFAACAGAALYRRSALDAVGLFDEQLYCYYEDLDWSLRAQLAGFSCRYVPAAVGFHLGSATIGAPTNERARYLIWRNTLWLLIKDFPLGMLVLQLPRILARQLEVVWLARSEGRLRILARAWRDALAGAPAMLRKRRAVQRSRTVTLRQLREAAR